MTLQTLTINSAANTVEPSLADQAAAAGIDVGAIDSTSTTQTASESSQKILGKFESQEALIKAYQELEKKQSGKPDAQTETETETDEDLSGDDDTDAEDEAREAAKNSGLDFDDLSTKFWERGGALEEAEYTALEKGGYPRNMVDQFIQGAKAVVELETMKVYDAVGGSKAYGDMLAWAGTNLSKSEVAAFDKAVNSDDMNDVMAAVRGLKARYDNEVGFEPTRRVGGRSSRADTSVYESIAQLTADMGKAEYKNDPAFRAKVEAKLGRSSIL